MRRQDALQRTQADARRLGPEGGWLPGHGGQIIDASIIAAPKQHNTEGEKAETKAGKVPEECGRTNRRSCARRKRYLAQGVEGLRRDASRPGRKPPLSAAVIERVVEMTLHETLPGATHWSVRRMARAAGISHTSVQRIWKAHELKPHLVKTFELSKHKQSV